MGRGRLLGLWGLLFCTSLQAELRVAFFEKYDERGQRVELERGGRFFHVAIAVGDQWLHSDSYYGVQLVDRVPERYGLQTLVLVDADAKALEAELVSSYLGRPYDPTYLWDGERIYCSELISKILELPPQAMRFDGGYWKDRRPDTLPEGELGSSPDLIYRQLLERGWRGEQCQKF